MIAVIAILAAILFPVFAQAKAAAKATVALSNAIENGLAVIMYAGDFDDTAPPATAWNTGNDLIDFGGSSFSENGEAASPWTWLIAPYEKSYALFEDPLAPAQPVTASDSQAILDLIDPQFGYNMDGMSPYNWNGTFATQAPASMSSFHSTAGFVMLASKWSLGGVNSASYWATYGDDTAIVYGYNLAEIVPWQDNGPLVNGTVSDPTCGIITTPVCLSGWGAIDANDSYITSLFPTTTEGSKRRSFKTPVRSDDPCFCGWSCEGDEAGGCGSRYDLFGYDS